MDAAPQMTLAHHAKVSSEAYIHFITTYKCCKFNCLHMIPLASKLEYAKLFDVSTAERRQLAFKELKRTQIDGKTRPGPHVMFAGLDFDVKVRVDYPANTLQVPICRRALLALTMIDESVWLSNAKQLFYSVDHPAHAFSPCYCVRVRLLTLSFQRTSSERTGPRAVNTSCCYSAVF